jgi:tetratricopeptide (TPR) repeat protein
MRAELLRTCGNALLKLGRNGEALPILEAAVAVADDAFDAALDGAARQRALLALIRSLSNLGSALFAVREVDTAIAMYRRAVAAADGGGTVAPRRRVNSGAPRGAVKASTTSPRSGDRRRVQRESGHRSRKAPAFDARSWSDRVNRSRSRRRPPNEK